MIIPGIFEETIEKAVQEINLMGNIAPKIQLDIADGLMVDGKTFLDLGFLQDFRIIAELQLHLMVQKPESFLLTLPPLVKDVCAQAEAFMYNPLCIESYHDVLKAKSVRVGLSFNPQTPFEDFEDCIKQCDYAQFMTVNPGAQGRPFIMQSLDKIARFKEKYPNTRLQVDGGITTETMRMVVKAGANDVVVGSQIFKSTNPAQTYQDFVLQFDHAHTNYLVSRQRHSFGGETHLKED
ncbi:hypothetical protein COT50_04140 [candidate division WWE3 bacterium CG08_land_8_20_14_0_20_41_10]|uniref:Ribulose-phosphate 3-epimerase n=1 Tax=candidate division WWE3 bacterium CG08_land_8_20_14_0_20_41_10 TaxID=1975085 RepID=A0A2H0XAU4_UNCKA|nr:MAG: hypothetical protein COT50_04140 [candidate division WWE3 bacterium CG08_land_8_20_14_0_20_41_10]